MTRIRFHDRNGKMYYGDEEIDDDDEYEPEDMVVLRLYGKALNKMANEDSRYESNLLMFAKWNNEQRFRWINNIEAQAQRGAKSIGVDIVTRVVILRLES